MTTAQTIMRKLLPLLFAFKIEMFFSKQCFPSWSETSPSCWIREEEVRSLMALQLDVLIAV